MLNTTGAIVGVAGARGEPELGRLKSAAERISMAADRIENFVFRFHGPRGETASAATAPQPPESYRNDMSTVFDQIVRIEQVAAALDEIG